MNTQILLLKESSEKKKRLELLIKKVKLEIHSLDLKRNKLTQVTEKEFKDVKRLEEGGLTSMFYSFLGNKVEKLDKERQEFLAAKLKLESCKNEISDLNLELKKIEIQLLETGTPEKEYATLIETKKQQLKNQNDSDLAKFEKLLELYFIQRNEISEALAAGEKALEGLNYAIHYLRKAKNWGTYDMLGGGLLATAIKHSNIDEAKGLISDVQIWLRKFNRELSDIKISEYPDLSVQMDSFSTFADYFFDNLIFDWVVQSKINRSLDGCRNIQIQVSKIIAELKTTDKTVTQKYKSTSANFNSYIEKTFQ